MRKRKVPSPRRSTKRRAARGVARVPWCGIARSKALVAVLVVVVVVVLLLFAARSRAQLKHKLRGSAAAVAEREAVAQARPSVQRATRPVTRRAARHTPSPFPPASAEAAIHAGIAADEHDLLFASALDRLNLEGGGQGDAQHPPAAAVVNVPPAASDDWLGDWLDEDAALEAEAQPSTSTTAAASSAAHDDAELEQPREAMWRRMYERIVASSEGKNMSADDIAEHVLLQVERADAAHARAARLRAAKLSPARPVHPRFTPSFTSLRTHKLPSWYADAKLGVVVNWGVYSVPGWAPVAGGAADVSNEGCSDAGSFWRCNPHATWYANSARIKGSPTARHRSVANAGKTYATFATDFVAQSARWTPAPWMETFEKAGVRYVVFAAKQHDGFCMWPTNVTHPTLRARGFAGVAGARASTRRDYVGETLRAARAKGLRTGIAYSGGLDWNFNGVFAEGGRPHTRDAPFRAASTPSTKPPPGFHDYALQQWRELERRYKPDILWNDVGFPELFGWSKIVADAYNERPDVVVNDRFVNPYAGGDFAAVSSDGGAMPDTLRNMRRKWELVRPLGGSFGYNRNEGAAQFPTVQHIIHTLVEVVAHGGNLLLGVGPKPNGELPREQTRLLLGLGAWLVPNREAIFGTRTWASSTATQCCGQTHDAKKVRFTANVDSSVLYAVVLADLRTAGRSRARIVRIQPVIAPTTGSTTAFLLRGGKAMPVEHWFESQATSANRQHGAQKKPVLVVSFPTGVAVDSAYTIRLNCTGGAHFMPTDVKVAGD